MCDAEVIDKGSYCKSEIFRGQKIHPASVSEFQTARDRMRLDNCNSLAVGTLVRRSHASHDEYPGFIPAGFYPEKIRLHFLLVAETSEARLFDLCLEMRIPPFKLRWREGEGILNESLARGENKCGGGSHLKRTERRRPSPWRKARGLLR